MKHTQRILPLLLCTLVIFSLLTGLTAFGQQAAPKKEEAVKINVEKGKEGKGLVKETEKATPQKQVMDILRKLDETGIAFLVVLALFSFVAATIVLERLFNLTRNNMMPHLFVMDLRQLAARGTGDRREFDKLAKTYGSERTDTGKTISGGSPIGNVLKAAMLRAGRPVPEVEKAMEDALSREVSKVRGRIRPLTVIGNVAPLVGLFGTVVGMIMAFYNASANDGLGKAETLAQGIYLALLTTAAGLAIAIPSMLFAAYFNGRLERYMREMDEILLEVIPNFAVMEQEAKEFTISVDEPEENAVLR